MAPVKRGDRILIETESAEVYEGDISNISKFSVELINIYIQTESIEYPGTLSFCCPEICTVTLIEDKSPSAKAESLNGNYEEITKELKLCPSEYNRLKEMTFQFIFIDAFGKKFSDAIKVLRKRERVAVAGLGNTFQRDKHLNLLLISDFKQIYIFDMLCLLQLKDLKDILKADFITKVVHGGEALFDCLYHKYNVEMVNVFDTQVVDSMMSKSENNVEVVRTLPQLLNHYFNFPLSLVASVMEEMNDKTSLERPMKKSNLIKASHLVAYLLTLRNHIMKIILKPYSDVTLEKYAQYMQKVRLSRKLE